jgi:hypothetical protein
VSERDERRALDGGLRVHSAPPRYRAQGVHGLGAPGVHPLSRLLRRLPFARRLSPLRGAGWIRAVYFPLLITHIILAAAIVPLALVTVYRALQGSFTRHVRIARWTLPIWLYVSVTGVLVYWMLHRL